MSRHDILPPTIVHISANGLMYTFKWLCKRCYSSTEEPVNMSKGQPSPSYVPMNLFNTHADCDSLMVERMLRL